MSRASYKSDDSSDLEPKHKPIGKKKANSKPKQKSKKKPNSDSEFEQDPKDKTNDSIPKPKKQVESSSSDSEPEQKLRDRSEDLSSDSETTFRKKLELSNSKPEQKHVLDMSLDEIVKRDKIHQSLDNMHLSKVDKFIKTHNKRYKSDEFISEQLHIRLQDDFSLCILLTFEKVDLSSYLHFGKAFNKYSRMYENIYEEREFQEITLMHPSGYQISMLDLTLCKLLKPEFMYTKMHKFINLARQQIKHLNDNSIFIIMFAACYYLNLEEFTNEKRKLVKDLRSLYDTRPKYYNSVRLGTRYDSVQSIKWILEDMGSDDLDDKIRRNSLLIFGDNLIFDYCVQHLDEINGQWNPIEDLVGEQDSSLLDPELCKKYSTEDPPVHPDLTQKIAQTLVSILENCTQTITRNFL